MSKHTPGPWFWEREQLRQQKNGLPLMVFHNKQGEFGANAKLIAAAPELAEALREALRQLVLTHGPVFPSLPGDVNNGHRAIRDARAALKKAGVLP